MESYNINRSKGMESCNKSMLSSFIDLPTDIISVIESYHRPEHPNSHIIHMHKDCDCAILTIQESRMDSHGNFNERILDKPITWFEEFKYRTRNNTDQMKIWGRWWNMTGVVPYVKWNRNL